MSDPTIGRRVVACPGCGQERWHGIGPCWSCGAPGTAVDTNAGRTALRDLALAMCRDREHDSSEWAGQPCTDCLDEAESALTDLHSAGWRIVKTTKRRTQGIVDHEVVTQEWKP